MNWRVAASRIAKFTSDTTAAARAILIVGAFAAVGLELYATPLSVLALLVAAWVALPFVLLRNSANDTHVPPAGAVYLAGAMLLTVSSILAYWPTSVRSSSTSALTFFFLPLWQLIAVGVIAAITGVLKRRVVR